jgi:hypothetical protein
MSADMVAGLGSSLPDGYELWQVGRDWFAAYTHPRTGTPMLFRFDERELRAVHGRFTPPDRLLSQQEADRLGAVEWGTAAELDPNAAPWEQILSNLERMQLTDPWVSDPQAAAEFASATLRGEPFDIRRTDWHRNLNQQQRAWMQMATDDPASAEVFVEQQRQRVLNELAHWLGPVYGAWDDADVDRWANYIASNSEQGYMEFIQTLQDLRVASFPDWEDPNITYNQMAGVARQMFRQVWGTTPDESDPFFLKIAGSRDHVAAMEQLRSEGWKRGVSQVVDQATTDIMQATGGLVRRPM